jgi:signal transduction histidine kinase
MRNWYWMPVTVFVIGLLSIGLLLWVERINERLLVDELLVDAIMDTQIRTATYHLRLEEVLAGIPSAKMEEGMEALDQALRLMDLVLEGGVAEYGQILAPLEGPELRVHAEEIKGLLLRLQTIGRGRLEGSGKRGANGELEAQFDTLSKEILHQIRAIEDILERDEARNQVKSKRLILGLLAIWGCLLIVATAGLWIGERQRKIAGEKLVKANEQLHSQADELTSHRERLEELVESRTAELRIANKHVQEEMAEKLQACEMLQQREQQVQYLSGKLLRAQEVERKRISMELHDELGQDLNVIKLQISAVKKSLRADQEPIREECGNLLGYIDRIIEDVRRLSLSLSPTILEDLGLTAALRWLVKNLEKCPNMKIAVEIAEIDPLFSKNNWITIYRIIQEALTNIAKHARAEKVSIVIRPFEHSVLFSIEDNGEGFDLDLEMRKESDEKGFGLTTLKERIGIMGGTLDLWSRKGEGTRLSFSIPMDFGEA